MAAEPDLEEELDRLYALPLSEFVGARNELARRLRVDGEREAAEEVKALAKPSVTAWVVNALYHHDRERFDELLEAAAAVRAALAGKGDRRKAETARREALKALLGRAVAILADAGHASTPANRQRISHTLEALAARDPGVEEPRPGRLAADLEAQGVDVLAGLAASLASPGPSTAPKPAAGERPSRKSSPANAGAARDGRLAAARQQLTERRAELLELERQAEQAEAAAREATQRHRRLTEEAAEAERRARASAQVAAAAEEEMAAAKRAASEARAARRRGRSRLETARRRLERQRS